MSTQIGKLLSLILQEHFSDTVEKVAMCLFHKGKNTLPTIIKYVNLPPPKIKLALCILIKQGIVTFEAHENEIMAYYQLLPDRLLLVLRYPKFMYQVQLMFGPIAEILLEELLICGCATISTLFLKVQSRLKKEWENKENVLLGKTKNIFEALVTAKYLKRFRHVDDNNASLMPNMDIADIQMFTLPDLSRVTIENVTVYDSIYWTVNVDRLEQDLQDRFLISAVARRIDAKAAELFKLMLTQMYSKTKSWMPHSNPIYFDEIRNLVHTMKTENELKAYLQHYLIVLQEDEINFVTKIDDTHGGQYVINIREAIMKLCWSNLECVITEKYGAKAARIFRLVKMKDFIETEQIQQLAMIPAKEARKLSYLLLEENYLKVKELKKSGPGPVKNFVLFHIELGQVIRMSLENCYKVLYNCMRKRIQYQVENNRFIQKKKKIDAAILKLISEGASQEEITENEEVITEAEKLHLVTITKVLRNFNILELELDDDIILYQLYLIYN